MSLSAKKQTKKYVRKAHRQGVYKQKNICYNFDVKEIVADFLFVDLQKGAPDGKGRGYLQNHSN